MKRKKSGRIQSVLVGLFCCLALAAGSVTLWHILSGGEGAAVRKVQAGLSGLGYYDGPIDGKAEEGTRAGLLAFQKENGLVQTGKAEGETLTWLLEEDLRMTPTAQEEILSRAVASAGQKTPEGRLAVAAMLVNRVGAAGYPSTLWNVAADFLQDSPAVGDEETLLAARQALLGVDPVDGAVSWSSVPRSLAVYTRVEDRYYGHLPFRAAAEEVYNEEK